MKPRVKEAIDVVVDYVLEHEGENYHEYCKENNLDIDSDQAINSHVYGAACKVLGRKPSYYMG